MEIQKFNRQQLREFVSSDAYLALPDLPISMHRALAQVENPRVREEDVLLTIAWEQGELTGYLGLLPDTFFKEDGTIGHCAWLSCLWVHPDHRGKSLARKLINKAHELYDHRILLTEFAPETKAIYDKLGYFVDLHTQTGLRVYYRFDLHNILPPKKKIFKRLQPVLNLFDLGANVLVDMVSKLSKTKNALPEYEYYETIDTEIQVFLSGFQSKELFQRGKDDLNWIIKYPWVLAGKPDDMSRRYHFSSVDKSFDFISCKIYNTEHKLCAFLILSKRNRSLKIPCCYIKPGFEETTANVIDAHIQKWQINTLSIFHPQLVQYYRKSGSFSLLKKDLNRIYISSQTMANDLVQFNFQVQDGDGDSFFT